MRSSKSRSRHKSNRNRPSGGGNVMNRVFDSSGPEGKVRGTPQQIIEKYNQLARDSHLSGDRVATENFQQHAEHYLRLMGAAQKEQDARREVQERENRERQVDRDRDRARRQEQEQESSGQPATTTTTTTTTDTTAAADPSTAPQPDFIDAGGRDSGLVETPESQPSAPKPKPKRSRKPRVETPADAPAPEGGGADSADSAGKPDTPEAAE